MDTARLVWVTRAQPGADRTAERLRAIGFEPLAAPLLTVSPLPAEVPDLDAVGALAFTSANAVRAFAALTQRRDLPAYAVGAATAEAVAVEGLAPAGVAQGGVDALAALIIADRAHGRSGRAVLHPTALHPAGDLVGALNAAGVPAARLTVYETLEAVELPGPVTAALDGAALQAVLLHSPRAARRLAQLMQTITIGNRLSATAALGLSPACLSPLADLPFAHRAAAHRPTDRELLNLL